jgi:hypothetical protein
VILINLGSPIFDPFFSSSLPDAFGRFAAN